MHLSILFEINDVTQTLLISNRIDRYMVIVSQTKCYESPFVICAICDICLNVISEE